MTSPSHSATTTSPTELPADLTLARVADLARLRPGTIRVFQRHAIDFCCGGGKSLAEAASRAGVALAPLVDEIRESIVASDGADRSTSSDRPGSWLGALPDSLADLAKLIVGRYHVALRGELPRLVKMADRVEAVHGAAMPEVLPRLTATIRALEGALVAHMREEEASVFPAIERLELAVARCEAPGSEGLAVAIAECEREHVLVGEGLREIRALTSGHVPPEWACNTFRGLYHGLAELEREVHEHVHLENNVLFPLTLQLAATGRGGARAEGAGHIVSNAKD